MLAFDRAIFSRDRVAFDRASARNFDVDGRMHVTNCRITKANVCPYYGREIPDSKALGLNPNKVYMLYRHPEELAKAAPTFRNLQLMALHTKVTAEDAKKHITVGTVGDVSFDGTYLVADQLTVWDRLGIDLVETEEARELSSSYHYRVEMTPGVSHDGVAYDGVMRDIKGNHVALVPEGRAGHDVAVNDALPSELSKMKRPHLLARLIALGVVTQPADEAARIALDEKLCSMTAKDADPDDGEYEDDPENPGQRRKKSAKANPGPGKAGVAGGALASDEQIALAVDTAIKAKGYVTPEQAQTMANDAANSAVARVNALHAAREAVKPLVGIVALDSAEAVYKFALEHEKVALDGVPPAAYAALVAQRVALKTSAPVVPKTVIAADAASAAAAALPGLGRITVAA